MSRGQRAIQSSAASFVFVEALGGLQRVQGTSRLACARQVQSKAGEGLAWVRRQIECTQLQFWGSARAASSVVVVPTPTDPMGFLKSTRDFKARSAAKEHTNEVRSGGRDPGVRRPGQVSVSRQHARSSLVHNARFLCFLFLLLQMDRHPTFMLLDRPAFSLMSAFVTLAW